MLEFGGAAGCESLWERNRVDMEQFVMGVTKKSRLKREKLSEMLCQESRVLGLGWEQVS